jgi:hemerythrin-like domain-containing protein
MKATQMLMDEHRIIERVLGALEQAAALADEGQPVRPGLFLEATDFIRDFADGSHHHKEEGVLFGAMIEAGVPVNGGPIAVMLAEHEQARDLTRAMREAAEQWASGDEQARRRATRAAHSYAALLRQHIAKEDQILFPLADRTIPAEKHDQVLLDYSSVEPMDVRAAVHAKYVALADSLEREVKA